MVLDGLALTPDEAVLVQRCTGLQTAHDAHARGVGPVGRRGGKSRSAAGGAVHTASCSNTAAILAPGERLVSHGTCAAFEA